MRYKLEGINTERMNLKEVIMRSSDLKVLESMKATLQAFGIYLELTISRA